MLNVEVDKVQTSPAPADFRAFLQSELIRRCRVNPRYSLRAFARLLKLESSYLSKILQGKRSVTEKLVERLRTPLALDPQITDNFKDEVRKRRGKERDQKNRPEKDFRQLSLDNFRIVSDWYHYAILELTTIQSFKPDPKWIGRVLDIPVPLVSEAIERLLRVGMLEIQESGNYQVPANHTTVGNRFSDQAFRNLQRAVLEMALRALDEIPYEERDQSSMTMAIDSRLLPEAREKIRKFRRDLNAFMQQSGSRDSVYQLGVAFYPLTKREKTPVVTTSTAPVGPEVVV